MLKTKLSNPILLDAMYIVDPSTGKPAAPAAPVMESYCDTTGSSSDSANSTNVDCTGEMYDPDTYLYSLCMNLPTSGFAVTQTLTMVISSASGHFTLTDISKSSMAFIVTYALFIVFEVLFTDRVPDSLTTPDDTTTLL